MFKNVLKKAKSLFKKNREDGFAIQDNSKVIDLEKIKEDKKLKFDSSQEESQGSEKLSELDKINKNVVYIKNNKCIECDSSLTSCRKSAKNKKGHYYMCCNDCGCVMKVDENGNITNTKNILKELSEAYTLFKKAGANPREYSYTKEGARKTFNNETHTVPDEFL